MKKTPTVFALVFALVIVVVAIIALRTKSQAVKSNPLATASPISISAPVSFTLNQRSSTPLPGSEGRIIITLDDITRGQVLTTISWQDGKSILATRSLRQGDTVPFTVNAHVFKITLLRLTNILIGMDTAEFELAPLAGSAQAGLSEEEKIERLIQSLKGLTTAKFTRNGKAYTIDEAVAHLRDKWNWKKSEIKTAKDFIDIAASKSSMSGRPYLITFPDGTILKSGDWFNKQLAKQNAEQTVTKNAKP